MYLPRHLDSRIGDVLKGDTYGTSYVWMRNSMTGEFGWMEIFYPNDMSDICFRWWHYSEQQKGYVTYMSIESSKQYWRNFYDRA